MKEPIVEMTQLCELWAGRDNCMWQESMQEARISNSMDPGC